MKWIIPVLVAAALLVGCSTSTVDCTDLANMSAKLDQKAYAIDDLQKAISSRQWANDEQKEVWYKDYVAQQHTYNQMAKEYNGLRSKATDCKNLPEKYRMLDASKEPWWSLNK